MKSTLTASDVLADIEFELLQGAISRDALGQSIQLIRQHQNSIRNQAFPLAGNAADTQEILSQQFKINDMLITILQEMSGSLQEMQQKVDWVGQARRGRETAVFSTASLTPAAEPPIDDPLLRPTDALDQAMKLDAIHQKMETQPSRLPIPFMNGIIRRLRVALHNLVLFYVNRLAKDQAAVNHTFGDWMLHLNALNRHRQEEVEQLMTEVARLQAQLDAGQSVNE